MKIVVGHLFPDYLNIYADRGNIAVLTRRATWRGHELEVLPLGAGDTVHPGEHDLFYVGGGRRGSGGSGGLRRLPASGAVLSGPER